MTETEKTDVVMDINRIREILPHRFPFLMIDRVIEIDYENLRLVAIKNVTMNEPFFAGHYPDVPVMPGVLQVEAMAQAACIFLLRKPENEGKVPYFTGIDSARFRRQVIPGDQLRIECELLRLKKRVAKCQCRCLVNGEMVAEALLTCMLGPSE